MKNKRIIIQEYEPKKIYKKYKSFIYRNTEFIYNGDNAEIKEIVMNAYTSAERILKENIEKLHKVAKKLLDNEKISGEEFEAIFKE